jgi:penicillin amidase
VPATQGLGYALALRWSAHDPGGLMLPLARMNMAADLAQFKAAALEWSDPALNLVCADRHGDIGYVLAGRIPIRPQSHGIGPFDGWDGANDWRGYVPRDEKPALLNPPPGFVVTANNRVVGPAFPYYLSADYLPPFRAERIQQVLAGDDRVSPAAFKALQGDFKCLEADPFMAAIANVTVQAPAAQDLLERLRSWDRRLGPESSGGAIYAVLSYRLLENTFKDELGAAAGAFFGAGLTALNPLNTFVTHSRLILVKTMTDPQAAWFDDTTTPQKETLADMLAQSLLETDAFLRRALGQDPAGWRWGRLHRIVFQHPLGQVKPLDRLFNLGPFEAGGHFSTVWQSTVLPGMDFNYNGWTVSNRHIYDLADWDNSLGAIVPGQSGMWGSPHYSDQLQMWREVGHHPLYFSRTRVEAEAQQRLTLMP